MTLLETLQAAGVELAVVDGELRYKGARGALTDGLRTQIRERKAEIIVSLAAPSSSADAGSTSVTLPPVHEAHDPHATPAAPCAACGGVAWGAQSQDWQWHWVCGQCHPEVSAEEVASLPPVHDADDPWKKPSVPCAACGAVHWRVWCHDQRKVWQWICNRCRPLVVVHKDGRRWRA
jgi:hypothetical protein